MRLFWLSLAKADALHRLHFKILNFTSPDGEIYIRYLPFAKLYYPILPATFTG